MLYVYPTKYIKVLIFENLCELFSKKLTVELSIYFIIYTKRFIYFYVLFIFNIINTLFLNEPQKRNGNTFVYEQLKRF